MSTLVARGTPKVIFGALHTGTILRTLIRQMLSHANPEIFESLKHWHLHPFLDDEQVLEYFKNLWPLNAATQAYYIVVDGLDECDERGIRHVATNLARLVSSGPFHVFCSCRPDMARGLMLPELRPIYQVPMDVQPDLEPFIESELEERLQCGDLSIGDPRMILRIRDALVSGSHGMFVSLYTSLIFGNV